MPTKTCRKCGVEKDAAEFSPHDRSKDGLQSWCKACFANYQRIRRQTVLARYTPSPSDMPLWGWDTWVIPIRPDRAVMVRNIPADLTKAEANRITRILIAHAADGDPPPG
jgi:hypothetical protein